MLNYDYLIRKVTKLPKKKLVVSAAHDKEVIETIKIVVSQGIVDAILVGSKEKILSYDNTGILNSKQVEIIDEKDSLVANDIAIALVKNGCGQILMKGLINSSDFLRGVVASNSGLKTGRILSHLAAFEIPQNRKILYITDGGMNIAPSLEEKKGILMNAIEALKIIGISVPNVGILAANEQVNPKVQATVDAMALAELWKSNALIEAVVEGPIAFDVAVNKEAAEYKGIESQISGEVDLLLVPTIETGNALGKALIHYGKAKMAGIILGAKCPIVMTSRGESAYGKLVSIALARLTCSQ